MADKTTEPVKVNGFEMVAMEPFPPNENPFHHDLFNMGTPIGDDIEIMWGDSKGGSRKPTSLILVHKPTGQRVRIRIPQES